MEKSSTAASARPLFLVHGTDGFRARLRAHDLARALASGEAPTRDLATVARDLLASAPLGLTRISAREASPEALLMATASGGLFASDERRALLLEDAEMLDPARLRDFAADANVVLRANGAAAPLAKAVRELGGTVEEETPLDPASVESWLTRRARYLEVAIETDAIAALGDAVASDLERADQELGKLAAYTAGARIGESDVRLLVPGAVTNDVFELTQAVVRRDVRKAVSTLERLLDAGEPPLRLHGLLVWQFRLLLVAAGVRTEADLERAVAKTGLSRGAIGKWKRDAAGMRASQILRAYESLYNADLAMKTSVDPRAVFQLLVLDLCGVEGADLEALAARPPG